MKDKAGNKITMKEFWTRWKKGIEELTPIQKLKSEIQGTFVNLIGYIVALIAVIIKRDVIGLLAYGLILIFIGSVWTTGLKWLSLRQQYKFMNGLDLSIMNESEALETKSDTHSKPIDELLSDSSPEIQTIEDVMKGGTEKK